MKILTYIIIIVAIYLLLKLLSAPIKLVVKLLINAVVGLVLLFIFNIIGSQLGFVLDINLINCVISGIFGIPGVLVLAAIKLLL